VTPLSEPIHSTCHDKASLTWTQITWDRGEGTSPPRTWSGGANASCPQILSCFKISSITLLASQCSKNLANPMTLAAYSLPPILYIFIVHNITRHFWRKIQQFSGEGMDKMMLRINQNKLHVKKNHFVGRGLTTPQTPALVRGTPSHTSHLSLSSF